MSNRPNTPLRPLARAIKRLGSGSSTWLPLLLAASAPGIAAAQESGQQPVELGVLEVVGDWIGESTNESARTYTGARTVIEQEELHQRGALNLEDAMRSTPGVQVLDETGTGVLPNIGVRGLNPLRSERVQLLVDGYPIALGPYSNVGVSLFPVTMASINAVDIVRGGAAVHYGPNNVGGVLNFETRPIPYELQQTVRQQLTIAEETGNVFSDTYYRAGGYVTDKLALQLQANVQRGDGFRDHSDTDVDNVILDGRYFINDEHEVAAQLQYYDVRAELPGALSPDAYRDDRTQSQRPFDEFDADIVRGTLEWVYTPSDDVKFEWRNFAHDADRTFDFGQNFSSGGHWADPAIPSTLVADSPRPFKVYGTEPRLTLRQGNHTVTVGARYVTEDVQFLVNREELATGTTTNIRDWSLDTEAVAVYVSDTMSFMYDRLTVTPGVRYENVKMDFTDNIADADQDNHAEELLPGLTVGYQATDEVFLFANGQRSLVPVQIAQVSREGEVANETAWNYELGGRVQLRPDLLTSATLFRIDYKDQIQFDRTTSRFENLGETRHQGLELDNQWQATDNLSFRLGYTFRDTEQRSGDDKGNELPNAPRHHVTVGAAYDYQQWNASLVGNYVSESFSDAANTEDETDNGSAGELPDYVLLNAHIGRDFNIGQSRNLNLALSVNNLLDEDYYFRGVDVSPVGRVPAPGRAYLVSAQLDF